MESEVEPKLAPPGAGLPAVELVIARMIFNRRLRSGNRAKFNAVFQAEREKIRELVGGCDEIALTKRILIDRVRGLEDSSRFWSVWMTLDHLRIVNAAIARTIQSLAAGKEPPGKASTAAVKPSVQVTKDVVREYERICDELVAAVAEVADLKTAARYEHPWFGALDAFGWHALAAHHMGIHREQIGRIVEGVRGT